MSYEAFYLMGEGKPTTVNWVVGVVLRSGLILVYEGHELATALRANVHFRSHRGALIGQQVTVA